MDWGSGGAEKKLKSAQSKNLFCNDIVFLPKPVFSGSCYNIYSLKMPKTGISMLKISFHMLKIIFLAGLEKFLAEFLANQFMEGECDEEEILQRQQV